MPSRNQALGLGRFRGRRTSPTRSEQPRPVTAQPRPANPELFLNMRPQTGKLSAHLPPGHLSLNSLCWQRLVARREAVTSPFVRLRDEVSRNRTTICGLSFGPRKNKNCVVNAARTRTSQFWACRKLLFATYEHCFDCSWMTPDSSPRKLLIFVVGSNTPQRELIA